MSAADWTAPVACALLMGMSLAALSQPRLRRAAVHEEFVAGHSIPAGHTGAQPDQVETFLFDVPAGSFLIVGSLDRHAGDHRVTIDRLTDRDAVASRHRPRDQTQSRRPGSMRWIDGRELVGRAAGYLQTDPAPAAAAVTDTGPEQACAVRTPRRFCVPLLESGRVQDIVTTAALVSRGQHVQVFSSNAVCNAETPADDSEIATAVVNFCESIVLPYLETHYTALQDIDGDGRLTIVLCNLQTADPTGSCPPEDPILGCVRRQDYTGRYSDFGGDIIYLDRSVKRREELLTVLMHEVTHAATFSYLAKNNSARGDSEATAIPAWLNEAIAHYFERRVSGGSSNLQTRLALFAGHSHRFPVVVPDAQQLSKFGRGGCRAAGALFAEHVIHHNAGLTNPVVLLSEPDTVWTKLESVTGRRFAELFRDWTVSLLARRIAPDSGAAANQSSDPAVRFLPWGPSGETALHIRGTAAAFFDATQQRDS